MTMKPKAKYLVRPYEGTHVTMEKVIDKEGRVVDKERKVSGGFMVKFPRGHSIYVESPLELARLKLDGSGFVDMDTGLDIPIAYVKSMGIDQDPSALEMEG